MKRLSGSTSAANVDSGGTPNRSAYRASVLEKHVQKAILDYCAVMRIFVQRRNVAGIQKFKGDFYVRLGTKGMADLWGIGKNGRHWECEVKRPGNRPTPDQESWLAECTLAGAAAFWVDSVDEFMAIAQKCLL